MAVNDPSVVLVQPPIADFYLTKKRTIPYGLALLAADLKHHGFDASIVDGLATPKSRPVDWPENFDFLKLFYPDKDISLFSLFSQFMHHGYSHEHIASMVRDKQPFLVGISSLFTAYADQAMETAAMIKKFHPECTIVMGGHHPTQFADHVLAHPAVDYVIKGEGENSLAALCLAVKNGRGVSDVPGISYKTNAGIVHTPPAWLEDLGAAPLPAFDLINEKYYRRCNRASAIVVSSRGCPMHCSYCSVAASSSMAPYRQRPVEDVIRELEQQMMHSDVGFIDFEDENLCLNKKWFLKLFERLLPLIKDKGIELRAMNGLYPPSLDEEVIQTLCLAGFKTLNLSLGSISKQQLKRFRRPDTRFMFENALALAAKYNLACVSYLIGAAPGQDAQTTLDDLIYLAGKPTLIGYSVFYPSPGSRDYKLCAEKKLLPSSFALMRSTALPISDVTSRTQSVTLLRLSRIINFIKSLLDSNAPLPEPEPFPQQAFFEHPDRLTISTKLLQWFLHDGVIRGVSPSGRVYEHMADSALTRFFVDKISTTRVCGVKGRFSGTSAVN